MAEKDFIKDGLTNEVIISTIKEILEKKNLDENKNLNEMDKYEKFKKEYNFFADRYPMLFELTLRNQDFDWNSLNYFLEMRNKIIDNQMTSEDASIKVGKEWFNKHININKLPKNKKRKV